MKSLYARIIGGLIFLSCHVYGAPTGIDDSSRNFLNHASREEIRRAPISPALRQDNSGVSDADFQKEDLFEGALTDEQPVVDYRDPEAVWIDEFVRNAPGPDALREDLHSIFSHWYRPFKKSDYRSPDRRITLNVKRALVSLRKGENASVNDRRVVRLMLYLDGYTKLYFEGDKLYGDRLKSLSKALLFYASMNDFGYPINDYNQLVDPTGEGRTAYINTLARILTNRDIDESSFNSHMANLKSLLMELRRYAMYGELNKEIIFREAERLLPLYVQLGDRLKSLDCQACPLKKYVQSSFGEISFQLETLSHALNVKVDPEAKAELQRTMIKMLGNWLFVKGADSKESKNLDDLAKSNVRRIKEYSYYYGGHEVAWERDKRSVMNAFRLNYLYYKALQSPIKLWRLCRSEDYEGFCDI